MGFNSNGTGLFSSGSSSSGTISGGVNGVTAWGADATKLALGGTMLADTQIDGSGFALTYLGQMVQKFNGVFKVLPSSSGSHIVGYGFSDFTNTPLARISLDVAVGDLNIETHPGAATPEIVVNYATQNVTIKQLGIGVIPAAGYAADVSGRIRMTSDSLMDQRAATGAGIIGLSMLTIGGVEKGFFKTNIATGDITIGGAAGFIPAIISNAITSMRFNTSGFVGIGTANAAQATSRLTVMGSLLNEANVLISYLGDPTNGITLSFRQILFPVDSNAAIVFPGSGGIYSTDIGHDFAIVTGDAGHQRSTIQYFGDFMFNTVSRGPVIKSPDGTNYRIVAANGGALSTVAA